MTLADRASSKASSSRSSEMSSTMGVSCRSSNSRPMTEAMGRVSLHRRDSRFSLLPVTSRTPSGMRAATTLDELCLIGDTIRG